jgi:LCP family protein required for cell wall assembly
MSNPSPALAAFLSFVFPGLGQAYAGDARKGVVWAVPMFLIIIAGLLLLLGGSAAFTAFLTAERALALIVFDLAFFLYHVAATIDAFDVARRARSEVFGAPRSGSAPVALAVLVSATIVLHGLPAMVGLVPYYNFAIGQSGHTAVIPQASFAHVTAAPVTPGPSLPDGSLPISSQTPTTSLEPGQTPTPDVNAEPTDTPTPSRDPNASIKPKNCPAAPDMTGWRPGEDGRLDILLVGSDSRSDDGVSSASLRTDSMLLLSVDIAECKGALFSFPRNLTHVNEGDATRYPSWLTIPTESNQPYNGYLFGLWRDAAAEPQNYPGSDGIGPECQQQFDCERGWRALTYAIQQMAGVNLDGVIAVNLKGFVDIVENLPGGGIWLDIPSPLSDDAYYNSEQKLYPVNFQKGCQFLGPEDALAYARSRHQDSDYQRERRQQFVLQSIRKQLDPLSLLPHISGLLSAAQANLFMSFSNDDFPFLAQVASRVDADRLYQYDFAPAHLTPLGRMQGMQAKVQNIFSEPEPDPTPQQQNSSCPPKN